ncbi:GIY-YIG nuclease family protein [Sphingomonas pituitosa]|uniref:GIY-YIG nuclease family protein n=1 Tax=Sphingomonas pituitosa TaxID=99597 RepID=UPI0008300D3E|nr:GIY-YIG nuclease family protein [Sphingomonas pituitosa]
MDKLPCVYMLASQRHGTLYTGVTSDLMGRIHQHRSGTVPGFTKRNNVKRLVWYEVGGDMAAAIKREKQLKEWKRDWKIVLIERENPFWEDLAISLGFPPLDAPDP